MKKFRKIILKLLKWLGIVIGSLILLLIILILLLRTPWAQQKITNYATNYVSDKTGTEVDIDRLFITFRGNVQLEGLYLEGLQRDTLLYSRKLETGVGISALINGDIAISRVDWDGLQAHISRGRDSTFNFQFLIDSLAGGGSKSTDSSATDTTASGPPAFSIGPVYLSDFRVTYTDSIAGMDALLKLGRLEVTNDEIDLDSMRFVADELHLQNTKARLVQFSKPPPSPDDSSSTPMPYLAWDQILLENLQLEYRTSPDTLVTRADIGQIQLGESQLALERQEFTVGSLVFNNNDIFIKMPSPSPADSATTSTDTSGPAGFQWPDLKLEVHDLHFSKNKIAFHQGPVPAKSSNSFDPQHILVDNLELQLPLLELHDEQAHLNLENLSFTEGGAEDFLLRQLSFEADVDGNSMDLKNFNLRTRNSTLQTKLHAEYPSIDSLMASPLNNLLLDLNIGTATMAVQDAYYFQDSLRYNSSIAALEDYPISISGGIDGRYGNFRLQNLQAEALSNTRLKLSGRVTGLPDTNDIQVNIPLISLYTTRSDLTKFIDTSGSMAPPAYLSLRASLSGDVQKLSNEVHVQTPEGSIDLATVLTDILGERPGYEGQLDINQFHMGRLLGNPSLGMLGMEMYFEGSGTTPNELDLETGINFQSLVYQDYDYKNLTLDLSVEDGKAQVEAVHKDKNLDMVLTASAVLDSQATEAHMRLNLDGIDLQDLKFSSRPLKLAFLMETDFKGNASEFDLRMAMDDIILIGEDQTSYRSDTVFLGLHNAPDTARMRVTSNTINGELQANTSFATTSSTIRNFVYGALGRDTTSIDTVYRDLNLEADLRISDTPMLHDVLLPNLRRMDSISLKVSFQPKKDLLRLDVKAPDLIYSGIEMQGLALDFDATPDSLGVDFGFDRLLADPINMYKTTLSASAGPQQGSAYLQVLNEEDEEITYLSADIDRQAKDTRISLNPDKLILASRQWTAPADNEIILADNGPVFHDFKLSHKRQQLSFESREEDARLEMDFSNFKLESILSMFNPSEPLLSGAMNGSVRLLELDDHPAFAANLNIDSLGAFGNQVGTLKLKADNRAANTYQGNLRIRGPEINLKAEGNYSTGGEDPNMDVNVELEKLGLVLVKDFLPDQLKKASGNISASVRLTGPAGDISYDGQLNFNEVGITPTMLGTPFELGDEQISLDNEGLYFDRFSIADASGDKLTIKGKLGTKNMLNPSFDLQIKASDFEVLDVSEEENDMFFGQASVNLDLDISGTRDLPVVDARVKLLKSTDVHYAVQPSQASINDREGLVRFRNMRDSMQVLNQDEEEVKQSLLGFDVTARILADPEARISILLDPRSNDEITVAGEANLNYSLFPNGNMELVGDYELSDGYYKLSLYELVKKKFSVVKGSRIVWNGDPMQAELDITAVYKTEASPVDLMSERLAGADQSTVNRYKQKLPFEVMLYVEGTIAEPEVSFGLQMPDQAKDALGGSVYSQVQQLNEDQNDLNKQVFSLVVFNRFLPSGVGTGSGGGGTAALARSSASSLLTNQLNRLSEKYIEGVELNFDVDSYTDYQTGSAQQRTDLNISLRKSFLNERVIVEVGSQVGVEGSANRSQVLSDVSVEYLLTEDGHWRLKGFQENQYQGIIEGQVRVTGLGLLFAREFNTWSDLFDEDKEKDQNKNQDSNTKPEQGED